VKKKLRAQVVNFLTSFIGHALRYFTANADARSSSDASFAAQMKIPR
jgi:hypothetical protein